MSECLQCGYSHKGMGGSPSHIVEYSPSAAVVAIPMGVLVLAFVGLITVGG